MPSLFHIYPFYTHICSFTPVLSHLHYSIIYTSYLLFHLHFIQGSTIAIFPTYIFISHSTPVPLICNTNISYTSVYPRPLIPHLYFFLSPSQVGATIILLRNINPKKGLCNGTRLIVRDLQRHVICAEIITSEYIGTCVCWVL